MRSARLAAYLFGGAAALGAAAYLVIYLYRWQWQRTIMSGVLLLIVEVLLLGLAVLDRVGRLERRLAEGDRRQEEILEQLRAAERDQRPGPGGPRFAWLTRDLDRDRGRTFVFVPVLMVAGVALSGLAWVVERIARVTVTPAGRRRLAGRLAPLAAPPGGPSAAVPDLPARPAVGGGPRGGRAARAGALVVAAALCAGLFAGLSALTETEPPRRGDETATSLLFTVDGNGIGATRAALAAEQVWERCRDATSLALLQAGLTPLDDGLYAAVIHPSLSDHDELRLRGCLEDAGIDRVQLHILGTGSINAADSR
ncbi:hypothetical protein [Streptomyces litchfieldiae]|uniref:LytR/CpsA/Psr regulator C-terminal domain-containing protein n=1 Tax=Streptomyces litchfieldiae TaxID=3075543 RepID=A0ABU2MN81_9ACTN|nr:hypothetical protein [Streptomyces sp. DSM 44938]MDT0342945.1 hypothetical protein [Streptomyces sp. DSM 44938]